MASTTRPFQSDAVRAFADVALKFQSLADSPPGDPEDERLALRSLLAELHVRALHLPSVFEASAGNEPSVGDALAVNSRVQKRFSGLGIDSYWDVFDPLASPPDEPVCNSFLDDLGDIYLDLDRGLRLFSAGHTAAAAWSWRFHFHAHWGEHLVGAQRALHLVMRDRG